MISVLICMLFGHKWKKRGAEIVVKPHESVAHLGTAIFQDFICVRCGGGKRDWVRHPYEEARKRGEQ
jgi:hypothetical protein